MKTAIDLTADRTIIQAAEGAILKGDILKAHITTSLEDIPVSFDKREYTQEQWAEIMQEAKRLDEK